MRFTNFKFKDTGRFSDLMIDYVSGADSIRPFYAHTADKAGLADSVRQRQSNQPNRYTLVSALRSQYEQCGLEVPANVDALSKDNAFTITTGHQLCLFTGPSYFIYKIASCIRLCQEMKTTSPDQDFVPVYWMASEDHDFEEISVTSVFGRRFRWQGEHKGPVGRMSVADVLPILAELSEVLGDSPKAKELVAIFEEAYQSKNLATATRIIVHRLFGQYGVVVLDGDDRALKGEFAAIMAKEITGQETKKAVEKTNTKLVLAGYKAQAMVREINLFMITDASRDRLIPEEDGAITIGSERIGQNDALQVLNQSPEKLSPNVILRPLYQETILPNIAYVGGGGELAYWMQLKSVFELHDVPMPVLFVRNGLLWIDQGAQRKIDSMDISLDQLWIPAEKHIKKFLADQPKNLPNLSDQRNQILDAMSQISEKVGKVDSSLQGNVAGNQVKVDKFLSDIEKRLEKAHKQRYEVGVKKIESMMEKLFPSNALQERSENISSLYLVGGDELLDELIATMNPLENEFLVGQL